MGRTPRRRYPSPPAWRTRDTSAYGPHLRIKSVPEPLPHRRLQLYDWACIQLPYDTVSGMAHWLLVRRKRSDPTELAYFRAWGPGATVPNELVRVAGLRWAIEESFKDAKGSVGLDQYEVRKWTAWYRHITLVLVAHAYLEVTRRQANIEEKGGVPISSR